MIKIDETLKNKIILKYLLYSVYIIITIALLLTVLGQPHIRNFFVNIENQTFDVRQNLISNYKKVNKNIAIISVDEASYEYILDKYGEWPLNRGIYADMVEFLQTQKPAVAAFDLMFVKSMKSAHNDDLKLAKSISKYDNVLTSINFDNQEFSLRKPVDLPDYLKANVQNDGDIDFSPETFTNCRAILSEIIDSTPNIGHINLIREDDGIARSIPPFVVYKGDFYPHLALKVGLKYLQKTENYSTNDFKIDKNGQIQLKNRTIPVMKNGSVILNWYGQSGLNNPKSFEYIPFWKVEKTMYGEENLVPKDFFKDKIVYIGTSATSLFDLKSVPTDKIFPGVEIHTTFINNLLDNNFIKRASFHVDIIVSLLLGLMVGLVTLRTKSTVISSLFTVLAAIIYVIFATLLMFYFDYWIAVIMPVLSMAVVFTAVYIAKYILKSRDFEYQYALATTDGLTELYNHRYFQEQMIHNVETAKRYNSEFSLIIIDIDFFKKFNDNYGHQSGDAVLKQVAQILKKNVRATDIACRYGGEEMALILTNTGNKDAHVTAQKICDTVAKKVFKLANDVETHVTISLGVSTYPMNGQTPQELIKYADECLYNAKENGRNQVGSHD